LREQAVAQHFRGDPGAIRNKEHGASKAHAFGSGALEAREVGIVLCTNGWLSR